MMKKIFVLLATVINVKTVLLALAFALIACLLIATIRTMILAIVHTQRHFGWIQMTNAMTSPMLHLHNTTLGPTSLKIVQLTVLTAILIYTILPAHAQPAYLVST